MNMGCRNLFNPDFNSFEYIASSRMTVLHGSVIFKFLRNPILFSMHHFTFLQRRLANSQQMYEKMFNIIDYQENTIKITMGYHLIFVRMAIMKEKA